MCPKQKERLGGSNTVVTLINNTGYAMFLGPWSYSAGGSNPPYCNTNPCTPVLYQGSSQDVTIPANADSFCYLNLTYTLCDAENIVTDGGVWCNGSSPGVVSVQFTPNIPHVFIANQSPSNAYKIIVSGSTYTVSPN